MMSLMGQKEEESASEQTVLAEFSQHPLTAEEHEMASSVPASLPISKPTISEKGHEDSVTKDTDIISTSANKMIEEPQSLDVNKGVEPNDLEAGMETSLSRSKEEEDSSSIFQQKTDGDIQASDNSSPGDPSQPITDSVELTVSNELKKPEEAHHVLDSQGTDVIQESKAEQPLDKESSEHSEVLFAPENLGKETSVAFPVMVEKYDHVNEPSYNNVPFAIHNEQDHEMASDSVSHDTNASPKPSKNSRETDDEHENAKPSFIPSNNALGSVDQPGEIEKVKQEMRMMESALKGAARQAQVIKF